MSTTITERRVPFNQKHEKLFTFAVSTTWRTKWMTACHLRNRNHLSMPKQEMWSNENCRIKYWLVRICVFRSHPQLDDRRSYLACLAWLKLIRNSVNFRHVWTCMMADGGTLYAIDRTLTIKLMNLLLSSPSLGPWKSLNPHIYRFRDCLRFLL